MAQTELRKMRKVFAQVDNLNLQSVPSVHPFTCHCWAPVICSNFCFHSWSYIPVCYIYLLVHTVNLVSPSWTVSPTQAESSSVLTEINTTAVFKQRHGSFLVFLRLRLKCFQAPSFGDILNTFSTAQDACRKEGTFISTSSKVAWLLASVLKDLPSTSCAICAYERR